MTDLEKFIKLYEGFGLYLEVAKEYEAEDLAEGIQAVILGDHPVRSSEKFIGYGGFYSSVLFDKDGKFIKQGFWE